MSRQARLALAFVAVVATACSPEEAPRTAPPPDSETPPPARAARPQPGAIAVHVAVPAEAGPGIEAWARELKAAIAAGHGHLRLAESEEAALVVVRVATVENGVKVTPEPPGEGEITVMRGALVVDGSARAFNLVYRGQTRPQAEALARHLRSVAAEGGSKPAEADPGGAPSS